MVPVLFSVKVSGTSVWSVWDVFLYGKDIKFICIVFTVAALYRTRFEAKHEGKMDGMDLVDQPGGYPAVGRDPPWSLDQHRERIHEE